MTRRSIAAFVCAAALWCAAPAPVQAQGLDDVGVRGFGTIGFISFTAHDTFDAVLDQSGGLIFGGGATVLLPWNLYVEAAAWRFKRDGERVFVGPDGTIFQLGIPLEVSVTPFELTGGYRFTGISSKFTPYAGLGYSSYGYKEGAEDADADEQVDERFSGFHLHAGVEYQVRPWLAVGGEVGWSSVADALGEGGASQFYGEDNLGGTSIRLKVSVGR